MLSDVIFEKKKELLTDLESQKDACTKYRKELKKSHETAAKSKVRYEHKIRDLERRLEKAENTRQELNKKVGLQKQPFNGLGNFLLKSNRDSVRCVKSLTFWEFHTFAFFFPEEVFPFCP